MTRPHYYRSIRDGSGTVRPDSTVALFQPGTNTPLSGPVFAAATGAIERGSTWVATSGIVDFYLELPQIVDIVVSPPGGVPPVRFSDQWVGDAENTTPEGLATFSSLAGQVPVADGSGSWGWGTAGSGVGAKETHTFTFAGAVTAPYLGALRFYIDEPVTISRVRASVGVAPAGADLVIDVNRNGTTLFAPEARPRILQGDFTGFVDPTDLTLAEGDYLSVDIDECGTTSPGAELVVQVRTAP